jgi:F420-dependent oxidoreductase-like protein
MAQKLRIGIGVGGSAARPADVHGLVEQAAEADRDGFDLLWHSHTLGDDSLIAIAMAGAVTERVELITGVIPVQSRTPVLMAQQALTAQTATGGRLSLGLGVAHPETVPLIWGQTYERPAKYMREYLSALVPLLQEGRVDFAGEMVMAQASLDFNLRGVTAPSVLIAALGPMMLKLAGEITDGTVLWVTGPRTIESHVAPRLKRAAERAGRDMSPRIVAALPICVTDDEAGAREAAARAFGSYGRLVNYRRVLDIEGVMGAGDVAVVGAEAEVEAQLRGLAAAGATDFLGAFFKVDEDDDESPARTRALLRNMVGAI